MRLVAAGLRARAMERLWSPVGATSGDQWQARQRLKQAKAVATRCIWLQSELDGKEGVTGLGPSEGLNYHLAGRDDQRAFVPEAEMK
jgi:hypothetical protein